MPWNRTAARDYIRHIRNPAKRAYAENYYSFLAQSQDFDPITVNAATPYPAGISYAAAQNIRVELNSILGYYEPTSEPTNG